MPPEDPDSPRPESPPSAPIRMDLLATTATVCVIGTVVLWFSAMERSWRDSIAIGSALLTYLGVLAATLPRGGRTRPLGPAAFLVAGLTSGIVAQAINGKFLVNRELGVAALAGAVIGGAQWVAVWVWGRLLPS